MASKRASTGMIGRLRRDARGNIMYLTAGLIVPILATIGSGVDLGQAYMAKTRLQQACDAGVLAGRRTMAEGSFTTAARTAATNMFNANYPEGIYDSTGVAFTPTQRGASEVTASATATIETVIMHMFGKETFDLAVNCTAKLEISNADIMFVLDTTGSMLDTNTGDATNKISALKTEVMAFFDTVADAQSGDSQIRYGVMPYSSNVNVGRLLYAANTGWVATSVTIPSRIGNFETIDPAETSTGPTVVYGTDPGGWSWGTNTGATISGRTSSNCASVVPNPLYLDVTRTAGPTVTTNTVPGANGSSTTTTTTVETWTVRRYRYNWNNSNCRLQTSTNTRSIQKTTTSSATNNPPYQVFRDYTYRNVNYNVASVLNNSGLTVPTGTNGAGVAAAWNGCIMERDTVAFDDAAATIPSGAYDLDIDLIPSTDATRWRIAMPNIAHPRASSPGNSQSATPADLTTTSDYQSYASGTNATGGWAACPSQAMKLTALTSAQRSTLSTYVNGLVAIGGTYHDVGMTWGTRFISPTGLFASENTTAPNGSPISRHIIFMTDGQMAPNAGIYGFQGQEYLQGRVGSTSTTELTLRHNRRFLAACDAAKARNVTVWVVSFGTALSNDMRACASGDKAYQASNNAQLRSNFQAIAQQITRLRLSE